MYNVTRVVHAANGGGRRRVDRCSEEHCRSCRIVERAASSRLYDTSRRHQRRRSDRPSSVRRRDGLADSPRCGRRQPALRRRRPLPRCRVLVRDHGTFRRRSRRSGVPSAVHPGIPPQHTPPGRTRGIRTGSAQDATISRRSAPGVSAESTQQSGTHHGLMSGSRSSPTSAHCRPSTSIIRFTGQWWTGGSTPNVPRPWSTTESVTRSAISPRDS